MHEFPWYIVVIGTITPYAGFILLADALAALATWNSELQRRYEVISRAERIARETARITPGRKELWRA